MWLNTSPESDTETLNVLGPTHLRSVDRRVFHAKGPTRIDGDVTADEVVCKGTATVGGDVSADRFVAKGATNVAGRFDAAEASFKGTTRIEGVAQVDHLDAKGASRFSDVHADAVRAKGTLSVDGVDADEADIRGVVDAARIEADEVYVGLSGDESTVGTIEATEITIERTEHDETGFLVAQRLVGDSIDLDHATVDEVVGEVVRVGPDAHVGVLRADRYEIDDGATVEAIERLS